MRKGFIIFLSIIMFAACQSTPEHTESVKTVLSGKITNLGEYALLLNNGDKTDTLSVDAEGMFTHSFELDAAQFLSLRHKRNGVTIYMVPGADLNIVSDADALVDSAIFTGSLAGQNNFYKAYDNRESTMTMRGLHGVSFDLFMLANDSIKQSDMAFIESAKANTDLDANFIDLLKVKATATWASNKMNYPSYHAYFAQLEEAPEMPADYYNFVNNIDVNNNVYHSIEQVERFAGSLIAKKVEDLNVNEDEPNGYLNAELKATKLVFTNAELRSKFMFNTLNDHIKYSGPNDLDAAVAFFKEHVSNTVYIQKIESAMARWDQLAKGMKAPSFTASDVDGKEYKLEDFLGKYVYIDVWATWCGPCVREIPFLKVLEHEFHDNNISFISVSVDNQRDYQKWKNMVVDENLSGYQLIAPNDWKSDIAKNYLIQSIPRFILIDMEGNMINVSAERPSGKISSILKALPGI